MSSFNVRGGGDHQTFSFDIPAVGVMSVTKKLTESDVNGQCRLMLKQEEVESQILCHWSQEEKARVLDGTGLPVLVYDRDDKGKFYHMTFKRNKSYVLNNNWSKLVKRRELKAGYEIGLHWDTSNRLFVFSVLFHKFL